MSSAILCLTLPDAAPPRPLLGSRPANPLGRILSALAHSNAGVAVLAAPGRTDVYAHLDESDIASLKAMLVGITARIQSHREIRNLAAIERLLHYAAGLETPLLGPRSAAAGVKSSLREAALLGSIDLDLAALFHAALDTAEIIQRRTDLNRIRRAALRQAAELAALVLACADSLLIVADDFVAADLVNRIPGGTKPVTIAPVARRYGRTSATARGGGRAASPELLSEILPRIEAVILCAPEPRRLITASMLATRDRPLLVVNLGSDAAVEPEAAFDPRLRLVRADALCGDSPLLAEALAGAEEIVREEARRLAALLGLDRSPGLELNLNSGAGGSSLRDARRPRKDAPQPSPFTGEAAA